MFEACETGTVAIIFPGKWKVRLKAECIHHEADGATIVRRGGENVAVVNGEALIYVESAVIDDPPAC